MTTQRGIEPRLGGDDDDAPAHPIIAASPDEAPRLLTAPAPSRMRPMLRAAGRAAILGAVLLLGYELWIYAHVLWWVDHNPDNTAFMRARQDELDRAHPGEALRHRWVPYRQISSHLKSAVIAAEDATFVDHEGFDWEGIQKALDRDLKRGRIVAGGSTISQQLAKNLFLSNSRTPWRKGQEALITLMLEKSMSKQRILEIYLNVIEWGDTVFGAEAAAQHYYGVTATQLGPEQGARLAAMVPNPRFYDKNRASRHLARKTAVILARMPAADVP